MSDYDTNFDIDSPECNQTTPVSRDSLSDNAATTEIVFDPDQDVEEKRTLRRDYRSLHKRIQSTCLPTKHTYSF